MFNADQSWSLSQLAASPFYRRLPALLADLEPPPGLSPINLSIGEPAGEPPAFVRDILNATFDDYRRYAPSAGTPEVKRAFVDYLVRRFGLPAAAVDPEANTVHVSGTREALFTISQTVSDPVRQGGVALMPDPSYPSYEAGTRAAGFTPVKVPTWPDNGFIPDYAALPRDVLERTRIVFLCNPANPQGVIATDDDLRRLVRFTREIGALLVVDECYVDLHDGAPPGTVLQAALDDDGTLSGVIASHSLSKRSSLPGLRSGFMAGDGEIVARLRHLRENGSAAAPRPVCAAAAAIWADDDHVTANRAFYQGLTDIAEKHLAGRFGFRRPAGGFFLWLDVGDGEAAARRIWSEGAVRAIPGSFLATPDASGVSCGDRYLRLALVQDAATIDDALGRLVAALGGGP